MTSLRTKVVTATVLGIESLTQRTNRDRNPRGMIDPARIIETGMISSVRAVVEVEDGRGVLRPRCRQTRPRHHTTKVKLARQKKWQPCM